MSSIIIGLFQLVQKFCCGQTTDREDRPPPQGAPQAHAHPNEGAAHTGYTQIPPTKHEPPHQAPHSGGQGKKKPDHHRVKHYENENLKNQNNQHYKDLRDRAREEGSKMAHCFDEAHKAHEDGDGARAKKLSEEGHKHQHAMDELNKEASDWIFRENNTDSGPDEVDLHGLYVKEAIAHTDSAIQAAQSRGEHEVHLIVGKGLHSPGGAAKLKPAIEDLIEKHRLDAHLDPENEGVLIVSLRAEGGGISADEITRRLEKDDESCIIM